MKLTTLEIKNYKQFINEKLNLEDKTTIIAGANNCGKTSLVELFNIIFGNGKFNIDDISLQERNSWIEKTQKNLIRLVKKNFSNDYILKEIHKIIFKNNDTVQPKIDVKIIISYEENDDLRMFADYLMDLSLNEKKFHFLYKYEINEVLFNELLKDNIDILKDKINQIPKLSRSKNNAKILKKSKEDEITNILIKLMNGSYNENAYFSDKEYLYKNELKISNFKELFNYCHINANRVLDDNKEDNKQTLSKVAIEMAKSDENWNKIISSLPDKILEPILGSCIKQTISEASVDSLGTTLDSISKTNGGNTGSLHLDFNITDESVIKLISNIIIAQYNIDSVFLNESSQGLGYSNLIYIHFKMHIFKNKTDNLKVNFFIIEEPEAHMHPQMQNAFTDYLINNYAKENNSIQSLVTTHSSEVVRKSNEFSCLRVLRRNSSLTCKIYDLRQFSNQLVKDKEYKLIEFYNYFFTISFPDIIFSDKVIMYEGDTERMYINSLLNLHEFSKLRNQYIAYVQVGGAYAFNYKDLITYLKIKSVILTDIDYKKEARHPKRIKSSQTTNSTINNFIGSNLSINELYKIKKNRKNIFYDTIFLAYQDENGFARTLEEAMLSKYFKTNSLILNSRSSWKKIISLKVELNFVTPNKKLFSIRDIVNSTSKHKTDFMYSVIMNKKSEECLPEYIRSALLWLQK